MKEILFIVYEEVLEILFWVYSAESYIESFGVKGILIWWVWIRMYEIICVNELKIEMKVSLVN